MWSLYKEAPSSRATESTIGIRADTATSCSFIRTAVQLTWLWIWGSICVRRIYKGGSKLQQLEIYFDYTLINFLGREWDTIILQKCAKVFFVLFWSFQSCILAKTLKSSIMNFQFQFILGPNSNPKCDICSPPTKHFMKRLAGLLMSFSVGHGYLINGRPLAKAVLKSILAGRTGGRGEKQLSSYKRIDFHWENKQILCIPVLTWVLLMMVVVCFY